MIQTLFGSLDQPEKKSVFDRMRQAVTRTRDTLADRLETVVALTREVDESALEDLEIVLISSDIGMTTTVEIVGNLRDRARRQGIRDGAELRQLLKEQIKAILDEQERPVARVAVPPEVVLMVGVNGTGKTTTSGKLAAWYLAQGRQPLLCAADTFRAAAIEQLEVWGERAGVGIIKTRQGGDPSAALYDALTAAKARRSDVLIVDTAGRLHTKTGLMAELDKMRRTAQRLIPDAPHEVLLVLDATTGQNGLQQARLFTESSGVTGIVLT
ncbi:MAG TPA: signal recognition particle-docking protein FtsY, partial [Acidobacteriaceae bacterium]